jgi:hypothetical protein
VCLYTYILEDCWTGWKGFRESCYRIFTKSSLKKEQAEYHCVKNGGHLVSISSKEEMEFVHGLIIYRIQHILMTDAISIGMLVKPAHATISIKQSPVLKGHFFLVLS